MNYKGIRQILYVDKFRGFEDTYIPLSKVNFFVGENSTGKTSILSLMNLLHDSSFWFKHEFNNDDIKLGFFHEIATKNNSQEYFKIGLFNHVFDSKNNETVYWGVLLKFFNNKGIPSLVEFSYIDSDKNYSVVSKIAKNGNSVQYKLVNEDFSNMSPLEIFNAWIQNVNSEIEKSGFNIIKFHSGIPRSSAFIKSFIDANIKEKENKVKKSISGAIFEGFMELSSGRNLCWIAPIRAKPKRTYDSYDISISSEGEHAPYLLKKMLSARKSESKKKAIDLINSFGAESRLFDSIDIKNYGTGYLSPFEIDVGLEKNFFKIHNVGYGVSQVLPIIVDILGRNETDVFAIQQPEVHLHPKAQAAFGEFLYKVTSIYNKYFIIETHSDYLIDRFRLNIHKNKKDNNVDAQVVFFERNEKGNKIHIIEINENGQYPEDQPESFNDFFIKEELELLEIDSLCA